jgi:hypothetical protein
MIATGPRMTPKQSSPTMPHTSDHTALALLAGAGGGGAPYGDPPGGGGGVS